MNIARRVELQYNDVAQVRDEPRKKQKNKEGEGRKERREEGNERNRISHRTEDTAALLLFF